MAAAMASATTRPPAVPDPFDLGVHTPANLNRGARTALLQNSPAVVNGPVGVPPAFGRTAQTPSSPLNAVSTTAATEGAQLARPSPPSPARTTEQQPVSLIESANRLARERVEEYNAKLKVFQAFCAKFEEAAKQFTLDSNEKSLKSLPTVRRSLTPNLVPCLPPAPNVSRDNQPLSPHPKKTSESLSDWKQTPRPG